MSWTVTCPIHWTRLHIVESYEIKEYEESRVENSPRGTAIYKELKAVILTSYKRSERRFLERFLRQGIEHH